MGARGPVSNPAKATGRLGKPVRRRLRTVVHIAPATSAVPLVLGDAGRESWERLVLLPWLAPADHGTLERLCFVYDELDDYGGIVDREGPLVPGSKMQPVAHPLLAVIDRLRAAAERLEIELGLTPMARQRQHLVIDMTPPAPPVDDVYADLRPAKERFAIDPRARLHSSNGSEAS